MITTSMPAEQRSLLHNISWQNLETLLAQSSKERNYRLAYNGSSLETATPLYEHESYSSLLSNLVRVFAEELDLKIKMYDSVVLKRQDVGCAIEPDSCYYIQNVAEVKGKRSLDLTVDPPPDLAIEVDITSSQIDKFSIYAALGVPELWRYNGLEVKIYRLLGKEYLECARTGCSQDMRSRAFPPLLAPKISRFLDQSKTLGEVAVVRLFRTWLRNQIA